MEPHKIVANVAIIALEITKINQSSKISVQLKGPPPLVSKVCRIVTNTNNAPIKESAKIDNFFFILSFDISRYGIRSKRYKVISMKKGCAKATPYFITSTFFFLLSTYLMKV